MPGLKRVLLVYDATSDHALAQLDAFREAARRLGLTLVPVRSQDDAQAVIASVRRQEVDGILGARSLSLNIPGFVLDAGARQAITTMFHTAFFVERGGLVGYAQHAGPGRSGGAPGGQDPQRCRHPATLPVEQPTKFDLVINLKSPAT